MAGQSRRARRDDETDRRQEPERSTASVVVNKEPPSSSSAPVSQVFHERQHDEWDDLTCGDKVGVKKPRRSIDEKKAPSDDDDNANHLGDHQEEAFDIGQQPRDEFADLLAKRLADLSMTERLKALDDVHGVSDLAEETPEMLARNLAQMKMQLHLVISNPMLSEEVSSALVTAMDKNLISDGYFLKFIRASDYDPKEAANRMLRHLEHRREVFGVRKLFQDLTMDDLGEDELKLLDTGWIGLMSLRSQSGRIVVYSCPFRIRNMGFSAETRARVALYVLCSAVEEELDQRRGILGLHVNVGPDAVAGEKKYSMKMSAITGSCPARMASSHIFVNKDNFEFNREHDETFDKHMLARLQLHRLDATDDYARDLHVTLGTLGVPAQCLPLTKTGDFDLTFHNEFVRSRRALEQSRKAHRPISTTCVEKLSITEPGPCDVVYGMDSFSKSHKGNAKYLSYVEAFFEAYDAIDDRLRRRDIFMRVLSSVHNSGGRFLQRDQDGRWREVPDEAAIGKIGNTFRSRRRTLKKQSRSRSRHNDSNP